jgi:hypothetical protein
MTKLELIGINEELFVLTVDVSVTIVVEKDELMVVSVALSDDE